MENIEDILWARRQAMSEETRPDDTVFLQLTLSEACLITYALLLVGAFDEPVRFSCKKLQGKVADIIEEQKDI